MTNILTDAEYLADMPGATSGTLARYGADLLGRAIGHESTAALDDGKMAGFTAIIRDIRLAGAFTVTQQVMIHAAITDVIAGA